MISDQNAKGWLDKFVRQKMKNTLYPQFRLENVFTKNADSPNCLEAKEKNPDGKNKYHVDNLDNLVGKYLLRV